MELPLNLEPETSNLKTKIIPTPFSTRHRFGTGLRVSIVPGIDGMAVANPPSRPPEKGGKTTRRRVYDEVGIFGGSGIDGYEPRAGDRGSWLGAADHGGKSLRH